MSLNISDLDILEFRTNFDILLQQKTSRLREYAEVQACHGEKSQLVTQFGPTEIREFDGRGSEIMYSSVDNYQRWITHTPFYWSNAVYLQDDVKQIVDVKSGYLASAAAAMKRGYDKKLILALGGNAQTGVHGTDSTSFLSTQVIPVTTGGGAVDVGMNMQKILAAKEKMWENEVDPDEPLYLGLTSKQMRELYNEIQATNIQYTMGRPYDTGILEEVLGVKIVRTQLFNKVGNNRECYMWVKSGIVLGIWKDMRVRFDDLIGKQGIPTQIYMDSFYGATRTQETKVVKILCKE